MRKCDFRRKNIARLCEGNRRLDIEKRRELAEQYGVSEPAIYLDMMYILADYDDKALRYCVRRNWANENARATKCGAQLNLDFDELLALFITQDGTCAYCGEHKARAILHIDHRIPLSRGGRHHISNIVLACDICNLRKSRRLQNNHHASTRT